MIRLPSTDLRQRMTQCFNQGTGHCTPLAMTTEDEQMVEADRADWWETAYLLNNPKNAKRLMKPILQASAGKMLFF